MRMNSTGVLKQVGTELPEALHRRLITHAARVRRPMASIVADWLTPLIVALPEADDIDEGQGGDPESMAL